MYKKCSSHLFCNSSVESKNVWLYFSKIWWYLLYCDFLCERKLWAKNHLKYSRWFLWYTRIDPTPLLADGTQDHLVSPQFPQPSFWQKLDHNKSQWKRVIRFRTYFSFQRGFLVFSTETGSKEKRIHVWGSIHNT